MYTSLSSSQLNRRVHNANELHNARVMTASFICRHASRITHLFRDIHPVECIAYDWQCLDRMRSEQVRDFFSKFNSEIITLLQCPGDKACNTDTFMHAMQHVAHLLRNSPLLFLWTSSARRVYDVLIQVVHGECISRHLYVDKGMCGQFPSAEGSEVQDHFTYWKKALKTSLCKMSATYISTSSGLILQAQHPRAALNTHAFNELYNLVVNKADKRLAIIFVSMLPEMMGAPHITALLQSLSMLMHKFVLQVIKSAEGATTRKFVRLFFAAAGQCTCHTKCSRYGKVSDIQLLAVCKTCRSVPVFIQAREPRCRRTLSSTSFLNTCSIDGNTSFIYVPLYRASVKKSTGQLLYEHWAYTLSLNHVGGDSGKGFVYMLCAGGRRTCTNVFMTDSLTKTMCDRCRQSNISDDTCLTEKVGQALAALCDGCIIAACCPLHAHLDGPSREVWLSILEHFASDRSRVHLIRK